MSKYSPGNPFAKSVSTEPAAPAAPVDVTDATVEVPEGGDTFVADLFAPRPIDGRLSTIRSAFDLVMSALDHARREAATLDDQIAVADLANELKRSAGRPYEALRGDLWNDYGAGKHATESGRQFSFAKPSGSRSTKYDDLKKNYPEAYAACVTTTSPKPDAVGRLSISKKKD